MFICVKCSKCVCCCFKKFYNYKCIHSSIICFDYTCWMYLSVYVPLYVVFSSLYLIFFSVRMLCWFTFMHAYKTWMNSHIGAHIHQMFAFFLLNKGRLLGTYAGHTQLDFTPIPGKSDEIWAFGDPSASSGLANFLPKRSHVEILDRTVAAANLIKPLFGYSYSLRSSIC